MTMTAACSTGRAPAPRTASYPPPITEAVATTAPAPAPIVQPVVMPVAVPAVEVLAVTAPATEAAAPRCDENGRPLAGNVRTKGPMETCAL